MRQDFHNWLRENYIIDYYKIGVADKSNEPLHTAEVGSYTDQEQLDQVRRRYELTSKYVYAKPATEQEFKDFKDDKEVPYSDDGLTSKDMDEKKVPEKEGLTLVKDEHKLPRNLADWLTMQR